MLPHIYVEPGPDRGLTLMNVLLVCRNLYIHMYNCHVVTVWLMSFSHFWIQMAMYILLFCKQNYIWLEQPRARCDDMKNHTRNGCKKIANPKSDYVTHEVSGNKCTSWFFPLIATHIIQSNVMCYDVYDYNCTCTCPEVLTKCH